MNKILVLVMVLMLAGCNTKGSQEYWEYDSGKSLEDKIEEVLITLQEIGKNNLLISLNEDEIIDRLDTIDMNIERFEEEREQLTKSKYYHMNDITFNLYAITTVAIYDSDPNNYMIKVITRGVQTNMLNYNSENLDLMIRHYNELVTALGELDAR